MSDFFAMSGYGFYVWTAYAVFLVVLLINTLTPFLQRRRILRDLSARLRRTNAKTSAP